jgi:hypothetical protein
MVWVRRLFQKHSVTTVPRGTVVTECSGASCQPRCLSCLAELPARVPHPPYTPKSLFKKPLVKKMSPSGVKNIPLQS